jgi:AraC-like DNA-binding protein
MMDMRHLGPGDARFAAGSPPEIRVVRGGCHRVEDIYQGVRMAHADIGFYLVDEAGMFAETDTAQWPYAPGRITVIPPWWYYIYRFRHGMGHAYLHVTVPSWPDRQLRRHLHKPLVLADRALVRMFRDLAAQLRHGDPPPALHLSAQKLAISGIHALAHALPGLASDLLHREPGAWLHLRPALELVDARLHTSLAVGDLARALDCSREHCARLFRRHLGQSPVRYIQERRVARAMELIRGGMTITDAARQVGAGTRQYLGRLVRRHLGRPPSALRSV